VSKVCGGPRLAARASCGLRTHIFPLARAALSNPPARRLAAPPRLGIPGSNPGMTEWTMKSNLRPGVLVLLARAVRRLAALTAGLGRPVAVLGKAAFLTGHACPALAGDLALTFGVHGREAAL